MATIPGRVLLGWMDRNTAVRFLQQDCWFDPQLTDVQAEAIWQPYRDRVLALGVRTFGPPAQIGLTVQEAVHAKKFMAFLNSIGPHEILGVHKYDLRELAAMQYYVAIGKSQQYQAVVAGNGWLDECLPLKHPGSQINFRVGPGLNSHPFSTYSEFDLPHGEFFFAPDPHGRFEAREFLRNVTAMEGADRTFLKAGYHRSFARVLATPTATVPSAIVAVARNAFVSPNTGMAAPGVNTGNPVDPLGPLGATAAKFGDFFTVGLFMDVDLRMKRYQLQVTANWVALDAP
jgi:hypothetical protein